jgi:hypothetical protein
VPISGFGWRSSSLRAKEAAAFKFFILYAIVIAERSESSACCGCIWQWVK